MSFFEIYKRGQGKYTRVSTFATVMVIAVIGAYALSRELSEMNVILRYGLPSLIVAGFAVLMFWMVNRPKSADFLIATEGEMKKVSWSSRKEVIGSTKVVIITTLLMAIVLFAVDAIFAGLFQFIGVTPQ